MTQTLATYFFSYEYLKSLAGTCKRLLAAVRSRELWRRRTVTLDVPEFDDPRKARAMMAAYCAAARVILNVRHLAMLHVFPPRFLLQWQHEIVPHFLHAENIAGFQSSGPLMGCASFQLSLPETARSVYVGVQQWRDRKTAYCRIDNVFTDDCNISLSLLNVPPVPHNGRSISLRPNHKHLFEITWNQRIFELCIDNVGISRARVSVQGYESVAPLAQVFVWIFTNGRTQPSDASFHPLPSAAQVDARITCALCERDYTLARPQWSTCPLCLSWICSDHIPRAPYRKCPNCPNQLLDYVGGSTTHIVYVS